MSLSGKYIREIITYLGGINSGFNQELFGGINDYQPAISKLNH
jgi:hypothetical protein